MKKDLFYQHIYMFYSFVFVLSIMNVFIESESLNYLIGLLAILMVIVSFSRATRLFKILSSSFLSIGGFIYLYSGESLLELPSILTNNMLLLTLLTMLPWMNSVVRSGRFDRTINKLMRINASDLGRLYTRSSATTLTLAAFLNLSAATISQDVLKDTLSNVEQKVMKSFISISTLRGFSLALLWSPLEILLATSLFMTDVSYGEILPWLLLISAIIFILDSIWGRFHFKKYSYESDDSVELNQADLKKLRNKIAHLAVALVTFLGLVIALGNLFDLSFSLTVTLLIFPYSFVWSLIMNRRKTFWIIGWNTWKEKTNTMQNFILLFISLSLFSYSIGSTTFLNVIQEPLLAISQYPLLVFFLIQITFIFLSMFGIHPLGTLGILTTLLTTLLTVYNPLSIAIVLATSSIATLSVGTYGLVVTLTSVNLELSPYQITISNLVYALVYGGVGSIIGYLLL
ncbi:hypothetical protein KQI76_01275 [Amphibacillus sp. MSJ-3]|uniref:hypothetical protein n=1 Tax=Amphibacillus sp. MSJ-3 TaxID=2841505 RepID=UPI001C0F37B4|nr:hypothetical protein [Amphibacillus sp. MSJ-3]MBU5593788.1 hypothetical protein [Amphibacillus sp. MSJ-3]